MSMAFSCKAKSTARAASPNPCSPIRRRGTADKLPNLTGRLPVDPLWFSSNTQPGTMLPKQEQDRTLPCCPLFPYSLLLVTAPFPCASSSQGSTEAVGAASKASKRSITWYYEARFFPSQPLRSFLSLSEPVGSAEQVGTRSALAARGARAPSQWERGVQ